MNRMKTAEVPLTAPELKFLIDLMWGAPISTVRETASRHGLSDSDVEGHLVKCLGYLACGSD
jgi:hypothetical protein